MKLTKRKGFNFFRSYYDVFNELENDKDKLSFIEALLDRQFQGVKPDNLKGMAKFAWISQVNSIDSQIKGYEDKTGLKLTPCQGGCESPLQGESYTPPQQVQEKGKEEEQDVNTPLVKKPKASIDFDKLLDFINKIQKRDGSSRYKIINQKVRSKYKARLKEGYTAEQIKNSIINSSEDKYHLDTNYKYLTPEFFSRSEIIDKHGFKTESKKTGVASKESFISNPYRNE